MFSIRLGDDNRHWFIFEDGRPWDGIGYRGEFDAIGALATVHPEAAEELFRLHMSVD
jgi:hypothetical protein